MKEYLKLVEKTKETVERLNSQGEPATHLLKSTSARYFFLLMLYCQSLFVTVLPSVPPYLCLFTYWWFAQHLKVELAIWTVTHYMKCNILFLSLSFLSYSLCHRHDNSHDFLLLGGEWNPLRVELAIWTHYVTWDNLFYSIFLPSVILTLAPSFLLSWLIFTRRWVEPPQGGTSNLDTLRGPRYQTWTPRWYARLVIPLIQ